jgi:LuxR family transcriptional regulator, maltose regulon positive regulatory protein
MKLVRTKLDPPAEPGELIDRPRLLERLEAAAEYRLTVVQAPAGYGKTSLLSQWFSALQHSHRCAAWLSIDATDRDAVELLSYVAGALGKAGVPFNPPLEHVAGAYGFTTPDALIAAIIDGLEAHPQPVFVFLDDIQLLAAGPLASLCQLIERSPPSVRFILAARATPDMHIARMRARGQLLELGVKDLEFTDVETRRFMAEAVEHVLSESELAVVQARTEGWVAGLKLASLALRQAAAARCRTSSPKR